MGEIRREEKMEKAEEGEPNRGLERLTLYGLCQLSLSTIEIGFGRSRTRGR